MMTTYGEVTHTNPVDTNVNYNFLKLPYILQALVTKQME